MTAVEQVPPPTKEMESSLDPEVLKRADGGSEEDQLIVGKHFLVLAQSGVNEEKNGTEAVKWLIMASKQGNEPATELLCHCKDTQMGITEQNEELIKWCINTSAMEKKIRLAARQMFGSLNKTHKEVLSKDEYMKAIKEIPGDEQARKLLAAAGKKIGDAISEDAFVKTISKKIQGKINLTEEEAAEQSEVYKRSSVWSKVMKHPMTTIKVCVQHVLEVASTRGTSWLLSLIPTRQIYFMLLLFVYSFITPDLILFIFPLFFFYLSIAAMIISTLQMFYSRQKLSETARLTSVLKNFEIGVDIENVESQFCWNSMAPYIVFFLSVFTTVFNFSLADKMYIPCSEFCVISLLLAISCFIALSDSYDHLTLACLATNLLASLPTLMKNFPDIPIIVQLLRFISSPLFVINIGLGFNFNFSLPSGAFITLLFLFIFMARKKSWQGFYRVLVPHLVCYFWWNFAIILFTYTTWWTLARATVGYLMLPLLVPLSFLTACLSVLYFIFRIVQSAVFGKILTTAILLGIPLALTQSHLLLGDQISSKYRVAKRIAIAIFCVIAIVPLFFIQIPAMHEETQSQLTWPEYMQRCSSIPPGETKATTAIRCSHLQGIKVAWNGTIEDITITKVENSAEKFLESIPLFIANHLRCAYGEAYDCKEENFENTVDYKHCQQMMSLGRTCHLKEYDYYTFKVFVTMQGSYIQCSLLADYRFQDQLLTLRVGDRVRFIGLIAQNLALGDPILHLRYISTEDRDLPQMIEIKEIQDIFRMKLVEMLSIMVRFFMFPLFEFAYN
ncbi:wolframin [Octopus sinensis]|uniref:Wolframin n=1 Tax=Octopus sinensis TaxID=2607531 RepID=A0A6P7TM83_9MOLL|nr:wolframin [Octopus sinensis]